MIKGLQDEIASHGFRGAVVPASRFDDLRREMEELRSGEYHRWSDWMADTMALPDGAGFRPRSLISVVASSPKFILEFNFRGKPVFCTVPPQYADEGSRDREVLRYINDYLAPLGFKAALAANLPQKLLAVHCGLGEYGRNNICFNEEFGSYLRVLSYVSDMPCGNGDWFPVRRMEICETCRACVAACPTNALDASSSIVNADKCLTFLNEFGGAFPDWVPEDAHHCLVGCMKCQDCCPKNAHNKNNVIKGAAFTEAETAQLLSQKNDEPYTELLAAKIKVTGISSVFSHLFPRNLAALLRNI